MLRPPASARRRGDPGSSQCYGLRPSRGGPPLLPMLRPPASARRRGDPGSSQCYGLRPPPVAGGTPAPPLALRRFSGTTRAVKGAWMKGIILAGGTGSRLFPLTKVTNKHLLPVGREPMIFHPVKKLTAAGIDEILIVTGVEHMGAVVTLLGSGTDFGCRFTYKVQDEAGGIAQALGLAENFVGQSQMCVILGDNIFAEPITAFVKAFRQQDRGARLLLKQVPDPQR